MADYALMRNGVVHNVVNSRRTLEEVRGAYPNYDIEDFDALPLATKQAYLYYEERA